jgi:hypothetical protein
VLSAAFLARLGRHWAVRCRAEGRCEYRLDLPHLPTNMSRHEIAAELSVSVNTVSAHIRSIYAKLQVSDRSSAVRRARDLRLLAVAR